MYLRNGLKLGQTTLINNAYYDITWFDHATPDQLTELGVSYVPDPVYPDPSLYTWTENIDGSLTITPLPSDIIAANKSASTANNIQALWQAAHDYEYASINGSAVGLVTIGLLRGLPKCIAVSQWVTSIWALYYTRKATTTDVFDPSSLDFSSIGSIPYSIPELMAEVGV